MKTLVIGDVHGNPDALMDILTRSGAVVDGVKQDGWTVISVGDVANMAPLGQVYRGFVSHDVETLELAKKYVDVITVGNHEVYYTHGGLNVGQWYGMAQFADPERLALLNEMTRSYIYRAAYSTHGWLITHAGVHPAFQKSLIDQVRSEYGEDFGLNQSTVTLGPTIEEGVSEYLCGYLEGRASREFPPASVIDGADGIFWLRPDDIADWFLRFYPEEEYIDLSRVLDHKPIKQIVGHTPDSHHPMYDVGTNTWYIDSGGYFSDDRGSGIVWNSQLEAWEVVQ